MSLSDSRCWMLTVEITLMPASSSSWTSCHRLWLRDPGTLVWASSSTRAISGCRASRASRSISSNRAPRWSTLAAGHHLETADHGGRLRPVVGLDESDSHICTAGQAAMRLAEHGVGLADAGCGSEVDPQTTAAHPAILLRGRMSRGVLVAGAHPSAVQGDVELQHVDARISQEAQDRVVGVLVHQLAHDCRVEAAGLGDAGHLDGGVGRADVGVEPAAAGGDRVRGHL